MKFEFIGYPVEDSPAQPGVGTVFRPIVPIRLIGSASNLQIRGLVDTGADETILTLDMAREIGARPIPNAAGRILSAGGEVPLICAVAELELAAGGERYRWPAVVGVAEQQWDEALLGFRGFLEYFDALFYGHALLLELDRNSRPFAKSSPRG